MKMWGIAAAVLSVFALNYFVEDIVDAFVDGTDRDMIRAARSYQDFAYRFGFVEVECKHALDGVVTASCTYAGRKRGPMAAGLSITYVAKGRQDIEWAAALTRTMHQAYKNQVVEIDKDGRTPVLSYRFYHPGQQMFVRGFSWLHYAWNDQAKTEVTQRIAFDVMAGDQDDLLDAAPIFEQLKQDIRNRAP